MSIWIDKWQFTMGVVIIYEEGGGGGGGVRKVSTFMREEAQKVCLQSGGGSKKFSILIFPTYLPPLPINNDHSLMKYTTCKPGIFMTQWL
jgi:hypothetical protein